MQAKRKIYILGHKNPDTDSICSAIALAYLKNRAGEELYVPKRAGQMNEETEYVLRHFKVQPPAYLPDVGTQIKDMEIRRMPGASKDISVREAWEMMQERQAVTLPLTDDQGNLEGIVTVGDITTSMMNQNPKSLSEAKTPFAHIARTLNGEIEVGDKEACFEQGKVFIGAANPDLMRQYIEKGDLIILGNRAEDHLCAVEMGASCIVVGLNAQVSPVIRRYAEEMGCVIIRTPYDTYTITRMIALSMPVRALMLSEGLVTFHTLDFTDKIRGIMGQYRFRDFPILDMQDRYVGTISRRNLLNMQKKRVILVDHNELSQTVDNINEAEILEIIDHHRIGNLETMQPIAFRNQPVGCTATIVYQMYQEQQVEVPKDMAGLLCAAILSDTLMFRSPTCTPVDKAAARALAQIAGIEVEKFAMDMFRAGSDLKSKTAEEIFYQDFKKFIVGEMTFGVGQISSMAVDELKMIKERLEPNMEQECGKHGIQMVFFMLTNILEESTELLCYGAEAGTVIRNAFGREVVDGSCVLPGVVSRKKQLIPAMMQVLQEA
ncbi:MAG TPA: inorganic diphosphatase [Lachnospiraceae bacterium]|nr:inorganic diphosphatase [Lachnospiraceae bacterium]